MMGIRIGKNTRRRLRKEAKHCKKRRGKGIQGPVRDTGTGTGSASRMSRRKEIRSRRRRNRGIRKSTRCRLIKIDIT
jgi:hypothetical protein